MLLSGKQSFTVAKSGAVEINSGKYIFYTSVMTDPHQPSLGGYMACFRNLHKIIGLAFLITSSSFAIAGFGLHWGNDLTLSMKDKEKEWLAFDALSLDTAGLNLGSLPSGITSITGKNLPIYLSRTDWKRTNFNIGGKIYIDIIPFIDAIELSSNFGLWQYQGSISYPDSLAVRSNIEPSSIANPEDLFTVRYKTIPLTLKEYDMGFLGLEETPYMKLGFDLTVRKYLFKFPPVVNVLSIYGGGGMSLNFATPIINRKIIESALGKTLEDAFSLQNLDANVFSNQDLMKEVLKQILSEMMTPHAGCHIDLGAMVKLPVVPIGFYVDGKFMIPFDKMDENVDLGGYGIVLNTGVSFSF